jgi:hypothetical protein
LSKRSKRRAPNFLGRRPADAELAAPLRTPAYADPSTTSDHIRLGQFDELGATGSVFLSGILVQEEYNTDLVGEKALRTYDKMYRSDSQIGALFSVLTLPLLQAKWEIVPASESVFDKRVAQHVQDNLFGGMRQTWAKHLEFALRGQLRDGFAVEEIVYELGPDGLIRIKKLAPRLSKTIYRTYPNDDDELDRVMQRVWVPNEDGIGGEYEYPVIPGSRLLWHTFRQEGNDFFGISVLRQAYKNWFFKDAFLKIAAVAAERMAVGVPIFKEPQNPQKSDRDRAAQVLQSLHAYQKTYVLEPFGWEFRFETPNSSKAMNLLPLVEYHDLQMARSALAQFLNLDDGGSFAMMKDISSFFLQAEHALARDEEDLHNAKLIRPLVDLNFRVDRYPTLKCTGIDKRSLDGALQGIAQMFQAGAITKTPSTENAIRSMIDLPDLDEKELEALRKQELDQQKAMAEMSAPLRTESGGPGASRSDEEAPEQPKTKGKPALPDASADP